MPIHRYRRRVYRRRRGGCAGYGGHRYGGSLGSLIRSGVNALKKYKVISRAAGIAGALGVPGASAVGGVAGALGYGRRRYRRRRRVYRRRRY